MQPRQKLQMICISNEGGREDSFGFVILSQPMNVALNENQMELSTLILSVSLKMFSNSNGFPN